MKNNNIDDIAPGISFELFLDFLKTGAIAVAIDKIKLLIAKIHSTFAMLNSRLEILLIESEKKREYHQFSLPVPRIDLFRCNGHEDPIIPLFRSENSVTLAVSSNKMQFNALQIYVQCDLIDYIKDLGPTEKSYKMYSSYQSFNLSKSINIGITRPPYYSINVTNLEPGRAYHLTVFTADWKFDKILVQTLKSKRVRSEVSTYCNFIVSNT
jgi:hypothetical protein